MVGQWPPSKGRKWDILASGKSVVIIGFGVQKPREDKTRSIDKKEALQLKKKCQINGYKVPKSKSHQFIIVQKCQSLIMEKSKEHRESKYPRQ